MAEDVDIVARAGLIGFTIDLDSMSVVFEGGFSVPIVGAYDRFDMETDDPDEIEEIDILMPPDGIVDTILMDDIIQDRSFLTPEQLN
jgi:hypothetical protein